LSSKGTVSMGNQMPRGDQGSGGEKSEHHQQNEGGKRKISNLGDERETPRKELGDKKRGSHRGKRCRFKPREQPKHISV